MIVSCLIDKYEMSMLFRPAYPHHSDTEETTTALDSSDTSVSSPELNSSSSSPMEEERKPIKYLRYLVTI
jgi:hypothetical protein